MARTLAPQVTRLQELIITHPAVTISYMAERDELQGFAQRLNELCDEMAVPPKYNGRQGALGKLFSAGQKGARKWLEGEAYPAFDKIIRIAKWANVNVEWLSSGRGPKYLAPPEPDASHTTPAKTDNARMTSCYAARRLLSVLDKGNLR